MSAHPKSRILWPAAFACLLLAGCNIVPDKREIRIYSAQPTVQPDAAWPRVASQLVVQRPDAGRLTDSSRIIVQPEPGELQVYQGAAWSQPVPDMVQDAVLRLLQDSGKVAGTARRGGGIAGDYDLAMDIRRFQSEYTGAVAPSIVVEISATMIRNDQNRVVAQDVFSARVPAAGTSVAEVAAAFEQALGAASRDIAGWSLRAMQSGTAPAR